MFQLVLLRLTESYFRHRWLYLLPIVLMIAVAAVYPSTVESTYIAHGNMYVQKETLLSSLSALPSEGFGWVTPAQATKGEMDELLRTDAFMRAVIQQSDLATELVGDPEADATLLNQVRWSIWATPLGNSLVMISASHENPRVAHQLAAAMINTFIQWKINLGLEGSMAAQTFFEGLVQDYRTELAPVRQELTDYLTTHPEPLRGERPASEVAEIARLEAIVDQRLERVRQAESKEENARLAMVQTESDVRQTYFMVDEPTVPTSSTRSLKKIALIMALCVAGGGMLAIFAVVGGALLDQTYRFPIDVRHDLNLPVLAMVPEDRDRPRAAAQSAPIVDITPEARSVGPVQGTPLKPRKPQRLLGYK